jgi:hypothetical protein
VTGRCQLGAIPAERHPGRSLCFARMHSAIYPAIRFKQADDGKPMAMFAAPASEIVLWSGVVQRKRLDDHDETIGFQRVENASRVRDLSKFMEDEHNVIQNPLLCAAQDLESCVFEPLEGDGDVGHIHLEWSDLSQVPILELLERLQSRLESRLPQLAGEKPPPATIARLRSLGASADVDEEQAVAPDDEEVGEGADSSPLDSEVALFDEETHLKEFWEEVAARVVLLREVGSDEQGRDSFLGFSREAIRSYLQPVLIVDGQHRLAGAVRVAEHRANETDEGRAASERLIAEGVDAARAEAEVLARCSRRLPISLLLDDSPEEHVFQFVVVNQKATPIGRALLGTIVSTSLTADELDKVAQRLTQAGIPLESARAIAAVTRDPASPFFNLVQRGLMDEGADLLPWSVMASLVSVFRDLKNGQLFGGRVDYADKWKRNLLGDSKIVSGSDLEEKYEQWCRQDGAWRDCFRVFWSSVRSHLGSDDRSSGNYWGSPRNSNLFNKVSLMILTADFFQFLTDRDEVINSTQEVERHVERWLQDVRPEYFARDWRLEGIKKDNPGIRKQWARLWVEYRKDPQRLIRVDQFRLASRD